MKSATLSETTRQRVLGAAGEVFAEQGFEAATVRDICRKAGVRNIAAVNYYFGDKEHLYVAAVREAGRLMGERVPLPPWTSATPPVVKLRDFIATFIARAAVDHQPDWPCRLIMREMFAPTEACVEFVRGFVRPNFEILMGILQELLPADVPETKRHLIAFSIVGQCLHYRFCRQPIILLVGEEEFQTYDAARLADHIVGFTLGGLGLHEPRPDQGTVP